jgi:hypothetical protein
MDNRRIVKNKSHDNINDLSSSNDSDLNDISGLKKQMPDKVPVVHAHNYPQDFDREITSENDILCEDRPNFDYPVVSLEELKDPDYIHKCMFCTLEKSKVITSALKVDQKKSKSQIKSIFDKEMSSSNSVNIEQIQRLYQDLSVDDMKTAFSNGNEVIRNNLEQKYLTSREYYNTKIINDVIYNENTHIVSVFKDYLIFDDVSEFLKRQYVIAEARKRMPKVIEFYETYSKVFPNYVNLPENKFMFKNIERKQLYWDSKQQFLMEQEERNTKKKARIEDFGGVQNAPSSFFNESIDDKMFSQSFYTKIDDMKQLPDNDESFTKIVTLK